MLYSFDALGTVWNIELTKQLLSATKLQELLNIVINFENNYSRFLPNSKLTILNKKQEFLNPSQEFIELCQFALESYKNTGGVFNIGTGGILEKYGYGIPSSLYDLDTIPELTKSLIINPKQLTLKGSLHLDFGGFGKGWLIDKLTNWLLSEKISDFIINAGGDIFSNIKTEILIKTPDHLSALGTTFINKEAFAASSKKLRTWQKDNKNYQHIINFKNTPDNEYSCVKAKNAKIADMLATTFLMSDLDEIKQLASYYQVDYFIISSSGQMYISENFSFLAKLSR